MLSGLTGGDGERSVEEFDLQISDPILAWDGIWAEYGAT